MMNARGSVTASGSPLVTAMQIRTELEEENEETDKRRIALKSQVWQLQMQAHTTSSIMVLSHAKFSHPIIIFPNNDCTPTDITK